MKKIVVTLLLATLLITSFVSCGKSENTNETTFTLDEFSIKLSNDYGMTPHVSFFVSYETADRQAVLVTRNRIELVEEAAQKTNLSLLEYANLVIQINGKGSNPKSNDDFVYYTYATYTDNTHYTYLATVHKSENAYWLVQFVCESDKYEDNQDTYFRYARSIHFNEDYEAATTTV